MRRKILKIKEYLVVCRVAAKDRLLAKHLAGERHHFVDDSIYYSMQDLVDIHNGKLMDFLKQKIDILSLHIRTCVLCRAKGFVCEICNGQSRGELVQLQDKEEESFEDLGQEEVIFPFNDHIFRCTDCSAVFHRDCFRLQSVPGECPKCARRKKRSSIVDDKK